MTSVVYQTAMKPQTLLFVAPTLLFLEIGIAFLSLMAFSSPLLALAGFLATHIFSVGLTSKEPHIGNIIRNIFLKISEAFGGKSVQAPRFFVPQTYDEKTEYYYEL